MTSRITTIPAHVQVRMALVQKFGLDVEYRPNYPTPRTEKRIQIRDEKHYTPRSQVTQYAEAIRNRAKFPPPVFTRDDYLVDGNTTTAAYRKLGQLQMEALVLDVAWEGADAATRQALRLFGAAANVANGRGLDKSEVAHAVEFIIAQDGDHYDATRIAALLGVTATTVSSIMAEKRTRERAGRLGIDLNGSLSATHLRKLGGGFSYPLNDGPWEDLVRLIQESGMGSDEINAFAKEAKEAGGDDAAQQEHIRQARESMKPRIVQYKRTGKSHPTPAAQIRQCIGATFAKHADDLTKLVEHGPDGERHLELLEQLGILVPQVAELQRQALGR